MSFVDAVRPAAASLADPAALWDSDSARSNPQGSFRGAHSQLPGGLALPRSQFTAHTDVDMPNSIVESVPYNNDSLKWAVYSRESQMLSSNQLEVNYEFVTCVMDASCLASDHLAIICYDISGFIQTFRYLTAEQVKLLARVHGVTHHSGRNDMHRSNVIAHSCSSLCPGNAAHLVFRRLKYPRRPKPLPHAPLTSRRVIDPLKIALTNDFSAPQPGIVRCGTLNSYFDFQHIRIRSAIFQSNRSEPSIHRLMPFHLFVQS
ncbi:hypothetical protein B0H16DRAFT_78050 [Mycena metata]|uniref:Uncharacterized protein n=1 Tax=Mycena metata TaxID=1033252 RepID=A0AAD7JYX6_9AGAR|nr:hypothetical protein B0H16DRAFT_78050 [Mycena metata]